MRMDPGWTVKQHTGWLIAPTFVRGERATCTWPFVAAFWLAWMLVKPTIRHPWASLRALLPHRCQADRCDLLFLSINGRQWLRVPNPLRSLNADDRREGARD